MAVIYLRRSHVGPRVPTEAKMQIQIDNLSRRVEDLTLSVGKITTTQELQHRENRKDIHDLRGGQDKYFGMLQNGFEKISDILERKLSEMTDKQIVPLQVAVHNLQLNWAKAVGYASGIAALGAVVFEVGKSSIEHALKP